MAVVAISLKRLKLVVKFGKQKGYIRSQPWDHKLVHAW